jgi:taurine dioxygenase
MMTMMVAIAQSGIEVRRLAGALGAEVIGIDLTATLAGDEFEVIHRALLDHQVICIRAQQEVTPAQQLDFAGRWGEVAIHPYVPSIEGYPGIMRIYDPNPITQTWHSDTTHAKEPPALTILLARVLPEVGGDTMFASAYLALETLSSGLRTTLATMRAVHKGTELAASAGLDQEAITAIHPVIRTHPETGRQALFVNGNYVERFDGWTVDESAPLLSYLYAWVGRPEHTYRHRWQAGDLIIWDNRCTQHAVVGDTGGAERVLHRVTIAGDRPA